MWMIKAIGVALAITAVCGLGYAVVFPRLLMRHNPLRPLDAFGWTAAIIWGATTLIVVTAYWGELALPESTARASWLANNGLQLAIASLGLVVAVVIRWQFRSPPTGKRQIH